MEIIGTHGNDTLNGTAGDDTIDGRAGADRMTGFAGNDYYAVDNAGDVVVEAAGGGEDGVSTTLTSYTLPANIEFLNFDSESAQSFTGTGNALDNEIFGWNGDDTLSGGDGDDFLVGSGGADTLIGGAGNDLYSVDDATDVVSEQGGQGTDVVATSLTTYSLGANVEAVIFGGDSMADFTAFGNALANYIEGWDGNDHLDGGAGGDELVGMAGDDVYLVDNSGDVVRELVGEGTDRVEASVSHTLRVNVENLALVGTSSIYGRGNALANIVTGNDGSNKLYGLDGTDRLVGNAGNDTLDGGAGTDTMLGGAGNDVFVVDSISDQLVETVGQGTDTVLAAITRTLGANFERLTLSGTSNINGTGNDLANLMKGNAGNNILSGRSGNDSLYGYAGADVLKGEAGNDLLEGGAGRDRFYGGTGADSYVFRDGDFSGVTASTADQIHDFNDAEGDRIRLSLVDANSGVAGDQAFALIGTSAFTGVAGQLRYQQISGNTYVQGDTNGDGAADFWIRLDGLHTLASDDFVF